MPLQRLLSLLRPPTAPAAPASPFEEAAARLERWAREATGAREVDLAAVEKALDRAAGAAPGEPPRELAADAASWLGEHLRAAHGGQWAEHPLLGLAIEAPGGLGGVHLAPLAMVEKKWALGAGLSLRRFVETLPDRLAEEAKHAALRAAPGETATEMAARLAPLSGLEATAAAAALANDFRKWWQRRHGHALALSLQGAREADRFLRSQAFLLSLREETLVQMGFFLGEVTRGLFQGTWDFAEVADSGDVARAALAWPELPYYPVGKVYKTLLSAAEEAPFDEYARLVPSARAELRKQTI